MSMRALKRLSGVCETRGARGLGRFLLSRLYTHRHDLLFDADTAGSDQLSWEGPEELVCVSRDTTAKLTPRLKQQIFVGEGADYFDGLEQGDLLFAIVDAKGDCLHHSFVLFDTRTKKILDEAAATPLFAHCITRHDARGQGFYPRVLRYALGCLAQRGHSRAIINCDPMNMASIVGIERAGFRLMRKLETRVFLSCVGWQSVQDSLWHNRKPGKRLFVM